MTSAGEAGNQKADCRSLQMNRDTPSAQIVDLQDAADHIPPEVVKDQNLPYWLPVCFKEGSLRDAIGVSIIWVVRFWAGTIEV